jgi:hypothetical protein
VVAPNVPILLKRSSVWVLTSARRKRIFEATQCPRREGSQWLFEVGAHRRPNPDQQRSLVWNKEISVQPRNRSRFAAVFAATWLTFIVRQTSTARSVIPLIAPQCLQELPRSSTGYDDTCFQYTREYLHVSPPFRDETTPDAILLGEFPCPTRVLCGRGFIESITMSCVSSRDATRQLQKLV